MLSALLLVALLAAERGPVVRPQPDLPAPTNGKELIKAMREKYPSWYSTLTFLQKTTDHRKKSVETWYEAARIPGMLRIDIAPIDSGKVILFRNDSIYQYNQKELKASVPFVHPLMVLGFDVYRDPVEKTVQRLEGLGFDLSKFREDTWQGRPVYVVGAVAGDTGTRQFWVDKERLVFVRSLETAKSGAIAETQFNKYEKLGKGWIAPEVIFKANGETVITEEYSEMKADMKLPDALFNGTPYGKPEWVKH